MGSTTSAVEDGLPERKGHLFLVGPTFSSWLNLLLSTFLSDIFSVRSFFGQVMVTGKISNCLPVEDDFAISEIF